MAWLCKHNNEHGLITISIRKDVDYIICTVDDNGAGFTKFKKHEHSSCGSKITAARIDVLNKQKGLPAYMKVSEFEQLSYEVLC